MILTELLGKSRLKMQFFQFQSILIEYSSGQRVQNAVFDNYAFEHFPNQAIPSLQPTKSLSNEIFRKFPHQILSNGL